MAREKILTQEEVDALLKGLEGGEVETTPPPEPQTGIRHYDLLNQERIIRGRMPTLDIIHDRFVRLQAITWTAMLRRMVDFTVIATEIKKFGEVLNKFPVPSALAIFRADPLRGHGVVVMDASLIYLVIDYLFGGSNQTYTRPEGRDFTPLQQRIIRGLTEQLLTDLAKAWQPVISLAIQFVRLESNPQFAMVVSAPEIVIAVTCAVSIRTDQRMHPIYMVYPYTMIEPLKEKLYAGFISDQLEHDNQWTKRLTDQIVDCPVTLTVQFGTATIRVRDLLNVATGDVLLLDQKPGDPAIGFIEGLRKLTGTVLTSRGVHAFRVTGMIRGVHK